MIYVDLDNTLIDSMRRLELEMNVAEKYGISRENFKKAIEESFEKHGISRFGHQGLYKTCRELKPDLSSDIISAWGKVLESQMFFSDSLFFLGQFPKEELTLLTTGNPDFQRKKIAVHGLEGSFGAIKIVASPKCGHIEPPSPLSFFVDDSPREIDAMKLLYPHMCCIQVREPALWEKQKISLRADVHCRTLDETLRFINAKR